jgi:transglutaminase-like putative cysteine protease
VRGLGLSAWLRAGALALAAAALAFSFAAWQGVVAAALAGFCGAIAGEMASRLRVRGHPLRARGAMLLALGAGGGLALAAHGLARLDLFAELVGTPGALVALDALRAFAWIGAPIFALRFAATRSPLAGLLELAAAATALTVSFAPHRAGMVHRPFAIGDFAWERGIDPAAFYLAIGAVGVIVLATLLVREQRSRRLPLHALLLLLLAAGVFATLRVTGLPTARPPASLAEGKDDPNKGKSDRKGTRGLEFSDDYSKEGQETPVAIVVLHDDYTPPSEVFYFRETAFSEFNGQRLVETQRDDVDRDIPREFPSGALSVPDAPPLDEGRRPLRTSVGLLTDHARPFALDAPVRFEPTRTRDSFRFQRSYEVVSNVPTLSLEELLGHDAGAPNWSDARWREYTEAPEDPRYAKLADEMLAQLRPEYRADPLARALVVKEVLEETGTYSLKSKHSGAADPTADFLFGDRIGYCVHFAHAAAYLLRTLGVPARVAAGYAAPAKDRGDGSALLLRAGNAHAWPEIYLDGIGWTVVDIAPRRVLDGGLSPADLALQRMLGEMLRDQLGEPGTEPPIATKERARELARGLGWALVAALAACVAAKAWRRSVPRFARGALPRVAYRAELDRLSELGFRRRRGETRERFASRLALPTGSFGDLTTEHLRAALGAGARRDRSALRALAAGVRADLRTSIPLWRRVLGALDPFSWLLVR